MKLALLYGLLLWFPIGSVAQGYFVVSENTSLSTSGGVAIYISNSELVSNGELIAEESQVSLNSSFTQTGIGGSGTSRFGSLSLSSPNGEFSLNSSIELSNILSLSQANLNLNEFNLIMPTEETEIVGESNDFKVFSNGAGKIIKSVRLNSPQNSNPGNLGLSISSQDNLGLVEIHRSHQSTSLPSGESILKSYEIFSEFEAENSLEISLSYFDSEALDNSLQHQVWKSDASGEWDNIRTSIERNSVDYEFTASAVDSKPGIIYTVGPEEIYPVDISSIPTAFTPNGDGRNDTFIIPFIDEFFESQVTIVSRWGDIVYTSQEYHSEPWDGNFKGEPLPVATYYYVLKFGSNLDKEIKGNISIVR